jgi:hypothetical protein
MLGEAVERDDPIVREVLANSVEQLEEAVRGTRRALAVSIAIVDFNIENTTLHVRATLAAPIFEAPYGDMAETSRRWTPESASRF